MLTFQLFPTSTPTISTIVVFPSQPLYNNYPIKKYYLYCYVIEAMKNMKKLPLYITTLIVILMVLNGCKKTKEDYGSIPYANINITINPNSTMYYELNHIGGVVAITAPYPSKGIIIYRLNSDEFFAYERSCPYDPLEKESIIEIEASKTTAIDKHCGSRFLLTDGSPFAGPAQRPLKPYRTYFDAGSGTLRIYN